MLTTDDLKAIRKVIREEVTAEVKDVSNNLESQLRLTKMTISNEIRELDDRMKNVEIRLDNVSEKVDSVHKDLKKEIKQVVDFLDKQDVGLHKRVTRIEKHINLPQN